MTDGEEPLIGPEVVPDLPHFAVALDDDRFRQFLDHVPFGVAVAEFAPSKLLSYADIEFERLTATSAEELQGMPWSSLTLKPTAVGGMIWQAP